ncbi:hypothetical protein TRIATDRAFT_301005 [Trichoderma atroviride IMI 206040]|uniref:Uncharacterized protein n=1 Tax=Hypocrea atroviridis (strain ATCC 20476 / IMI 206040) TaxID=452589 RepID=G9P3S1_HYPAI|nr:uncharacterized protein TRIATDRAFT_301005 [Trichoderma atroviride IMI 206040]EHK43027.1 hypothetical protein TRIATDRAFT_301005 [Trichoderma atroviride IMI 206040]
MRLMKSWRNSFLHQCFFPLILFFATTMEKSSDERHSCGSISLTVFSFFPHLSLSLFSSGQHGGFEDEKGECLRADDVHFGRLIKGQGGAWEQRDKWCLFSKIKREPQLLFFFNFRTGANENKVVKLHLDSSTNFVSQPCDIP